MSKPAHVFLRSIVALMLTIPLSIVFTSCKDEKVDCDSIETQLKDIEDDIEDAFDDGDCDEVEGFYDDMIALLRKGKNCDYVEEIIDDAGYDDLQEFIASIEQDKLDDLFDDYYSAIDIRDCNEIEQLRLEILSELHNSKNCNYTYDLINDYDVENIGELMEVFEADRDDCCDDSEARLGYYFNDYNYAYNAGNCAEMEAASEKVIEEIIRAKNCDFLEVKIQQSSSYGYDDYLQDHKDLFQLYSDYWGC